ncbi:MAG: hypothetical protein IPH65_16210 [Dehalococcoidia bacterium]|nr:hypothetical protein [Dehalococcoidia bacterium]
MLRWRIPGYAARHTTMVRMLEIVVDVGAYRGLDSLRWSGRTLPAHRR